MAIAEALVFRLEARDDSIDTALELWSITHGVTSLVIGMPSFPWPEGFADGVLTTYVLGLRSTPVTSS